MMVLLVGLVGLVGLGPGTRTHCPPPHSDDGQQILFVPQSEFLLHSDNTVVNAHLSGRTLGTRIRHLKKYANM